jgi:hypothetical protein
MFRLWFVGEASWVHNRVHLVFAALSLVLLIGAGTVHAAILSAVVVGTLLVRILWWDNSRRGLPIFARIATRRRK